MTIQDDEIPTYVKDLIVRMDYVGHVKPGMKLNVYPRTYADPSLWYTQGVRLMSGENGIKTADFIDGINEALVDCLKGRINVHSSVKKIITEKAKNFRQGLFNLIRTYEENPAVSSRLRTSLNQLDHTIPSAAVKIDDDDIESLPAVPVGIPMFSETPKSIFDINN